MRKLLFAAAATVAFALTTACASEESESATDEAAEMSEADAGAIAELEGAATGEACGGPAGIICASDADYCQTEVGMCGVQDASGTCATKPQICTDQNEPVCGCDGQTYSNACEAAMAGVNVDTAGSCAAG